MEPARAWQAGVRVGGDGEVRSGRPMRRVQIIYYLCRNGQLEHPHFMELAQHPHQPLRLKDVMDKLTLLRGKGMPALFSWSCKRNYKNGYVWNDLSEGDVIYPSDGVEYVLKGSEIFPGCSSAEVQYSTVAVTVQLISVFLITSRWSGPVPAPPGDRQVADQAAAGPPAQPQAVRGRLPGRRRRGPEDDELGYLTTGERAGSAGWPGPNKAVSARTNRGHPVELPVEETSPPSSTSSDKPPPAQQASRCDEAEPNRAGSMLLQLIACGAVTAGPAKCGGRAEPRRSCGLVSRLSSRAGAEADEDEEEGEEEAGGELGRRFGRVGVQEKEYFSGSIIVDSGGRGTPLPASSLKRSNSYTGERGSRLGVGGIGEEAADERIGGEEGMMRGRCIPGRKRQPQQK
ncbi:hypothetical protein ZWY2020_007306 [Hordeum vulgare]|nr:hypothetical protein ZWY2020_007306 [Hordeum vulgare]